MIRLVFSHWQRCVHQLRPSNPFVHGYRIVFDLDVDVDVGVGTLVIESYNVILDD